MKKLLFFTGYIAFSLAACSAEGDLAKNEPVNNVYQKRIETVMAFDFTTLFTYTALNDAQQKMPDAFAKVTEHSKQRMQIEKGATEVILHVVVADGKCILWAEHYLDTNNGRMVESIHKKQGSHIMCIGTRENYPALYAEVTKSMAEKYNKLGNYADAATTTTINNLLDARLNTSTGSAEFRLRVTDSSTEVYALK